MRRKTTELTWLGHACFRIRGKEAVIITDPFDKESGYSLGKPTASIVTVSHPHPHHSYLAGIGGSPKVIQGPGEYEVANTFITGIRTYHDAHHGQERGPNTVYLVEIDDLVVCHLGDLGHLPSVGQLEEMSGVDILLVPVGGVSTMNATTALELISYLEPKLAIPMHYKTDAYKGELEPVDRFLKEMGQSDKATPQPKLNVTKSSLPQATRVVVLDYRR